MAKRDTPPIVLLSRWRTRGAGEVHFGICGLAVFAAALLLGMILSSQSATAAPICAPHADILKKLKRAYAEKTQSIGLSTEGKLLEVLVSATGSWTILVTDPSLRTCLVATGESWESLPPRATGPSASGPPRLSSAQKGRNHARST